MGFEWGWDDIDWIAVVVAVIANMALGMAWYSKFVFLEMWKTDTGMTDEKMREGSMPKAMGGMIVVVLISVISMALLIGTGDIEAGLAIGAIVGLGIAAALEIPHYLFAQQPDRLAIINGGNTAASVILTGAIIGAFNG
jgi:hypothetical protein